MKVMHLLQSHRFSGAENVVCQIMGLLSVEDKIDAFYCSRDGQIREALSERGIPFTPVKDISIAEVKRVIKECRPDIIHAHDRRASYIAAWASRKIPLISHIHVNNFDSRVLSAKSIAYLFAGLKAKHIFWVSDSSYKGYIFHSLLKNKSEVLYNVIDIPALYKKMASDEKKYSYDIVYLGRLTRQKNPSRLLEVFQQVIKKRPNVKIAVIGTGDLEKDVHKEATELNIMDNVDFLGFYKNPYKILHDSKLMILTSLYEGTPMCVLEAMSLGVPVVSTPTDGVRMAVDDKKTGFLSDLDIELVESCCKLIDDDVLRKRMSHEAKKRASELMDTGLYKEKILKSYKL